MVNLPEGATLPTLCICGKTRLPKIMKLTDMALLDRDL